MVARMAPNACPEGFKVEPNKHYSEVGRSSCTTADSPSQSPLPNPSPSALNFLASLPHCSCNEALLNLATASPPVFNPAIHTWLR